MWIFGKKKGTINRYLTRLQIIMLNLILNPLLEVQNTLEKAQTQILEITAMKLTIILAQAKIDPTTPKYQSITKSPCFDDLVKICTDRVFETIRNDENLNDYKDLLLFVIESKHGVISQNDYIEILEFAQNKKWFGVFLKPKKSPPPFPF